MDARPPQGIVLAMTRKTGPAPQLDPADRILALEELRDLGLLDEEEFAEAAAASLDERPDPVSGRASLGQGNRVEG
jgi:hypothetical protein